MHDSLSKITAFDEETTLRHTFLSSDKQEVTGFFDRRIPPGSRLWMMHGHVSVYFFYLHQHVLKLKQ